MSSPVSTQYLLQQASAIPNQPTARPRPTADMPPGEMRPDFPPPPIHNPLPPPARPNGPSLVNWQAYTYGQITYVPQNGTGAPPINPAAPPPETPGIGIAPPSSVPLPPAQSPTDWSPANPCSSPFTPPIGNA